MGWKLIPVTLLLYMLQLNVEAQKHPQLRYLGVDAGFNMAGIRSASQYDRHKKNFGANVNFSANYSFSDSKSVGASLSLEQKGATDPVYDLKTNMNYASLPVYLKLVTGKEPRFFFTGGLYAGWLINAKIRGEQLQDGKLVGVNENVSGDFRSFDYGLVASTGMMVRLYDDFDFIFSIRGSSGLLRITDHPPGPRPQNYSINVSIGYIYYIRFR